MKRLMIVDDEIDFLNTLTKLLVQRDSQLAVTVAFSAEDAIKKLEVMPADILITDLKLPRMNGLELSEVVRTRWPQTAIIIMTAYGTDDVIKSAFTSGAMFYIEKPFKIENLHNMIRMSDMKKHDKTGINKGNPVQTPLGKQQGMV